MFTCVLGRHVASTVLSVSKPSKQLYGDKECLLNGVTSSGRVWRKVPESDARSVHHAALTPDSSRVEGDDGH